MPVVQTTRAALLRRFCVADDRGRHTKHTKHTKQTWNLKRRALFADLRPPHKAAHLAQGPGTLIVNIVRLVAWCHGQRWQLLKSWAMANNVPPFSQF